MADIPKYVEHNDKLAREFYRLNGIKCFYPPVTKSHDCVNIARQTLFPFGYNPSITEYQNRLIMAYRWHSTGDATTWLAMAELDENFGVQFNQKIALPGVPEDACVDDPRLFHHKDRLYCSFVVSNWPHRKPPTCVVYYGEIIRSDGRWSIPKHFQVNYGKNDGTAMEKNWVFFDHDGELFCIYHNSPEQVVVQVAANNVLAEHRSPTPHWGWGKLHGGTTPIEHGGKLLRFFHSRLDNEPAPLFHRYYIGACLMEPEPPFNIIAVSSNPIACGSEEDETTDIERSSCHHRKLNVVFPCGAMKKDGDILLSIGVNDCQAAVLRLREGDLHLCFLDQATNQ